MRILRSLLLLPLALAFSAPLNFQQTTITRTIELGGATTQVTTQYNIKASIDDPGEYQLALSGGMDDEPAWWDISVGGKSVEGLRIVLSR